MERLEVVARTAVKMRARHQGIGAMAHTAQFLAQLCDKLDLEYSIAPTGGVMLGGAYSRLQLWAWDQPEIGGIIWLRDDLDAETRIFAIAHELGHYMLHRGEGINLHPTCDQREINQQADPANLRTEDHRVEEYTPRARRELEANAFAAELLAPRAHVRRLFTARHDMDAKRLATYFGISQTLAQRRLIDALLSPTRPAEPITVPEVADTTDTHNPPKSTELIDRLDPSQREAARTTGPALIVAGPGTGKTATLIGRAAHLIRERNIPPERMLALTFSNRATGEMRERLLRSGLPGERIPVMTIHAFAVSLMREYASRVPHEADEAELKPDFRILDEADAFLLMEELLAKLPLHYYRSLGNPTIHIHTLLTDFSHARDALLTPADYLALVEAMPLAPATPDSSGTQRAATTANGKQKRDTRHPPAGTFTAEQIARARERAAAYAVWDRELRQRGLVDFGGLIQRAVELLRADSKALGDVRDRYREIMVDEFQDTNRAAAELLLLVAGTTGDRLWVVGDHNQSIYRFRGASPYNLPRLVEQYPHLRVLRLRRCYRSVPRIVRLGSTMAARMAALATAATTSSATTHAEASATIGMSALREAMRPVELEPVRDDGTHPAIRRHEAFVSAAHEHMGLTASIQQHHALGYAYGDQAVLCRKRKQARQIAAILAANGVPVSQTGDFFDRPEVKDALMLVSLAAGPDARGILRAAPLLIGLIDQPPSRRELATVARALAATRHMPGALQDGKALGKIASLSATTRAALTTLGNAAIDLHNAPTVGDRLAAFLLRPGGYVWRLARIADGLDTPNTADLQPWVETPARAQQALVALGELVRLARRFDARWTQEPDFRARLSRAVTHRRAAQPAQPDALEPVPSADVAPIPPPALQARPSDSAPATRCFLHYLNALRASDVSVPVPAGEDDTVHVLTLHQSKGLEFPVVHLPGLAHGQFPAGASIHEEASPSGFRESDAPGEREAEERCLFYVGVTRARDVVIFTRATSYSKGAGGSRRTAQPSTLLALVDDIMPDSPDAEPLLSDEELARLETQATAYEEADDDDDDDEAAPVATASSHPPTDAPANKPVLPLHHLEQYLNCPRQYKYARSYGLLDPAENAVHRFHRYIRRGEQTLRDLHTAAPHAPWQAAEAKLQALWETDGPAGHAYDAFYWQAAEAILRAEWQAITTPHSADASDQVLLAQPMRAELQHCIVEVTADRAIIGVTPTADPTAQPLTVLVRLHTGRPREKDKDDLTLPLYYLAHQQQSPGAPVQIALAYAGSALRDQAIETSDPAPGDLVDMTASAKRLATKYLQPARKQHVKLDNLDHAAMGIAAGRFEPRPSEQRCASCAYCYVCPADPESPPVESRVPHESAV